MLFVVALELEMLHEVEECGVVLDVGESVLV